MMVKVFLIIVIWKLLLSYKWWGRDKHRARSGRLGRARHCRLILTIYYIHTLLQIIISTHKMIISNNYHRALPLAARIHCHTQHHKEAINCFFKKWNRNKTSITADASVSLFVDSSSWHCERHILIDLIMWRRWLEVTNQRPVLMSRDQYRPIRGQRGWLEQAKHPHICQKRFYVKWNVPEVCKLFGPKKTPNKNFPWLLH